MTTVPIANALKLSWVYHEVTYPEFCTTGVHTVVRDEADFPDLFTWMTDFVVDIFTPLMPSSILDRRVISVWTTGGGFTGWHQIASEVDSLAFGSGDPLPYQCAWSWGWRNTSEPLIALGRRRNRSFIGPIKKSLVQTDSRMSEGFRDSMTTALVLKGAELASIPGGLQPAELLNYAVVSEAEGVVMDANVIATGLRFDTMRSRAEKTPETPELVSL
jgi:hypothetical protein